MLQLVLLLELVEVDVDLGLLERLLFLQQGAGAGPALVELSVRKTSCGDFSFFLKHNHKSAKQLP